MLANDKREERYLIGKNERKKEEEKISSFFIQLEFK
jgi:hypothetical protein